MSKVGTSIDHESKWHFAAEQDGWVKAHDALRAQMSAIAEMIRCFSGQLATGGAIGPNQRVAAQRFVSGFIRFLHHHHDNEELIAFPYMRTRVALPEKVSADHKTLERLLQRFEGDLSRVLASTTLASQQAALPMLETSFSQLHQLCIEHFREEEEEALPAMRKQFTPREVAKNVTNKIVKGMSAEDTGIYFRPMSLEQRRAFARQEGIPFFVRWILWSRAAKYERRVWAPFQQHCLMVEASA